MVFILEKGLVCHILLLKKTYTHECLSDCLYMHYVYTRTHRGHKRAVNPFEREL